jgi:hypothetical protein
MQMSIVMPLLLSTPPLFANDVTTIANALASAVTIVAAAANVTAAVVVTTAATTATIVLNVVALTATIATAIGLASAGATDIALSAIVANAAVLTTAIATAFALASANATIINNAIALITTIAFRYCQVCRHSHRHFCCHRLAIAALCCPLAATATLLLLSLLQFFFDS